MNEGVRPVGRRWLRCLAPALVTLAVLAIACSPEAGRARSGGPGADIGNRSGTIDLHGTPAPFYLTPRVGLGIKK